MVGKLLIQTTLDLWSNSHGVICWYDFFLKKLGLVDVHKIMLKFVFF